MLKGERPHKPEFVYEIIRTHSLILLKDLIEYNIVGETKTPLLCYFLFIWKLKLGDIITTGQNMNYQTFSNLQIRSLLEKFFFVFHIDLRNLGWQK